MKKIRFTIATIAIVAIIVFNISLIGIGETQNLTLSKLFNVALAGTEQPGGGCPEFCTTTQEKLDEIDLGDCVQEFFWSSCTAGNAGNCVEGPFEKICGRISDGTCLETVYCD